jgi:hypothetical protein
MSKDTGGPAFSKVGELLPNDEHSWSAEGMTLRDWFAGKALQGLITRTPDGAIEDFVAFAYRYADAMLQERTK